MTTVPVASVTVTPASGSLYVGQTVQLTATPKDSAGNPLTGRVIAWSSDNTTVATVSTSGLVTGKGAGSATITAATGGKSGTSTITAAIVPVASVVVSPASASVATGNTVQLTATPKDSVGNTLTGRTITWSSSATSVASVSSSGLVTGVTIGSATITAATGGKSGSSAITVTAPPPPGTHTGWYAAPNGSSSGDGSSGRPWNLPTALSGGNGKVQPGDTVWLRGGTYAGQFRSTLTGTAAAPIVVRQYPGERAIIDGGGSTSDTFVADGSYSVFWGFEMTNSDPARCCSTSSFFRADMMVSHATHVKFINMIVHDGGPGYYTWSPYGDVEIYGAIIYNIGYDGSDRGHGHGMYLKNDVGPLVVRDNILFNSYGYGIHAYTNSGDGLLNGIHLEGNVSFNSGTLSAQ
ncbi:MAG TPA: Ig-like domain-containing protein, partial [Mycobacteriales bacterium]|nr:Ig-like domain-containing protein [Mycobacteriales bacterium]